MADRRPRELETLDRQTRDDMAREYSPPSVLPEVNPEPGYKFKWVATHVLGQYDPSNASRNMRDGWVPVAAADHPECQMAANNKGHIEIGGLLLCKNTTDQVARRDAYYEVQARNQGDSVKAQFMRQEDARMPLFSESRIDVARGGGDNSPRAGKFGSGAK
jgi:hypothetical protein